MQQLHALWRPWSEEQESDLQHGHDQLSETEVAHELASPQPMPASPRQFIDHDIHSVILQT